MGTQKNRLNENALLSTQNMLKMIDLRNKFDFLSVHEIMNTSGLVQSK